MLDEPQNEQQKMFHNPPTFGRVLVFENRDSRSILKGMSVNWLKVAQKMAEDARAQLAINRQRLREIIEKRDQQQATRQHPRNAQ